MPTYHPNHDRPLDRGRYALGDTGSLMKDGEPVWLLADVAERDQALPVGIHVAPERVPVVHCVPS